MAIKGRPASPPPHPLPRNRMRQSALKRKKGREHPTIPITGCTTPIPNPRGKKNLAFAHQITAGQVRGQIAGHPQPTPNPDPETQRKPHVSPKSTAASATSLDEPNRTEPVRGGRIGGGAPHRIDVPREWPADRAGTGAPSTVRRPKKNSKK